jgi:hypothetical protein
MKPPTPYACLLSSLSSKYAATNKANIASPWKPQHSLSPGVQELRQLHVPRFVPFWQFLDDSPQPIQSTVAQKSLDKRYTTMITYVMLARQISLLPPLPTTLTPLLRYSCKLLVASKKVNSFAIKQIHTLSAKHPGWGVQLCVGSALSATLHPEPRRARYPFPLLASPLFSWSYELLFPQLIYFDNYLRCPMFFRSALCFSRHSFTPIFEGSLGTRHFSLANSFPCHTSEKTGGGYHG